jgi:hypothetical protein
LPDTQGVALGYHPPAPSARQNILRQSMARWSTTRERMPRLRYTAEHNKIPQEWTTNLKLFLTGLLSCSFHCLKKIE